MTEIEFMRAAELRHMDRVGVLLLGIIIGFCVGVLSVTLAGQ
ncbi:hypothetical protein [Bradyrhizobium sp. ORS 86]